MIYCSVLQISRNAYNLVLQKHGDLLYEGVCDCIRGHLNQVAIEVAATANEVLLAKISKAWDDHKNTMAMVKFTNSFEHSPFYLMFLKIKQHFINII